ncbi:MAG: hypothetical protein JXR37_18475 [Kiritimatiellae bacterium]|nr:hypothetical protein [Kiritimatiellia bacterium]
MAPLCRFGARCRNGREKTVKSQFVCVAVPLVAALLWGTMLEAIPSTRDGADRYSVILQRKPFGAPPDGVEENTPPPPPSFSQNLRLSGLAHIDNETLVALVDTKSQKHYFLREGESEDGISLVSVDLKNQQVVLRRGEETATLGLQADANAPRPAPKTVQRGPLPGRTVMPTAPPSDKPIPPGSKGETIDKFLRENPNAVIKGTIPFPPPDLKPAEGKGETIERLLQEMRDRQGETETP